jgi:hypothetical protein
MKQFCRDLEATSKSAGDIARNMSESRKAAAVGEKLLPFIQKCGEMFNEIAEAQKNLAQSLETTFVSPLNILCEADIAQVACLLWFE